MKKYLDQLVVLKNKKVDVECKIKSLLPSKAQQLVNKKIKSNYKHISENYLNLQKKMNNIQNVEHMWQVEEMLQSALVAEPKFLKNTMWLLEKLIDAKEFAVANNALKANELIKRTDQKQKEALVWSYVWAESNSMEDRRKIKNFVINAEKIKKQWKFSPFISESDYALFSGYGGTTNKHLKNPGKPTLRDLLIAPVMGDRSSEPFDVHGFFQAFPEFKKLEQNPAWGTYGGYALESMSQIMYGPIELAAECLLQNEINQQ